MNNLQDTRLILPSACFCFIGIFLPETSLTLISNVGTAERVNK